MNQEFKEILERVNDPHQVKDMSDVSRVIIVPALVHLEERIGRLEGMWEGGAKVKNDD